MQCSTLHTPLHCTTIRLHHTTPHYTVLHYNTPYTNFLCNAWFSLHFPVRFRAKKARISLEQAISEALEALEVVSSFQSARGSRPYSFCCVCFCSFIFVLTSAIDVYIPRSFVVCALWAPLIANWGVSGQHLWRVFFFSCLSERKAESEARLVISSPHRDPHRYRNHCHHRRRRRRRYRHRHHHHHYNHHHDHDHHHPHHHHHHPNHYDPHLHRNHRHFHRHPHRRRHCHHHHRHDVVVVVVTIAMIATANPFPIAMLLLYSFPWATSMQCSFYISFFLAAKGKAKKKRVR